MSRLFVATMEEMDVCVIINSHSYGQDEGCKI
jgi:hypothetical protein